MKKAASKRRVLLRDYGLLDGQARIWSHALVELAAKVAGTPMASISFVEDNCEWFLASTGLVDTRSDTNHLFCEQVVRSGKPLEVEDAHSHEYFSASPLAQEPVCARFYLGLPLVSPEGMAIGALAVLDVRPRHLAPEIQQKLQEIAGQAIAELELQRVRCSLIDEETDSLSPANLSPTDYEHVFEALSVLAYLVEPESERIVAVTRELLEVTDRKREDIVGRTPYEAFPADPSDPMSKESVERLRASLKRAREIGRDDVMPLQRYAIRRPGSDDNVFEERFWSAVSRPIFGADGRLEYIVHQTQDMTPLVKAERGEGGTEGPGTDMRIAVQRMEADLVRRTEELRRANEHLRLAQSMANIGSWELRIRTMQRTWSDEIYRILGVSPDSPEVREEQMLAFVHPEDRERVVVARDEVLAGARVPEIEHRIVRPDGSIRHVVQRATLVRDESGEPELLYGTMQDVTEHRRIEQEVKSRARQQEVVAELGQLALKDDTLADLFQVTANRIADTLDVEFCKILHLLPDRQHLRLVAGVGWEDGLVGTAILGTGNNSQAGYTLDQNEPVIVKDLRTDPRFDGPKFLRSHGVVSGINVIVHGDNGPWGVIGAHTTRRRDFTQDDVNFFQSIANILAEAIRRAETEEALKRSEQQTRNIIDTALDAVIAIDQRSCVTEWNPRAEEIFGWKHSEVMGEPLHKLIIPEEFRAAHVDGMAQFEETGTGPLLNRRVEVPALRRDGSLFAAELSISPVHVDGKTGFSAFISDITDRKRAELAVRESEERFRMVAKATADTIWDWNLETDAVWWSEGMRTIFGYPEGSVEPDSRSFLLRIHPDDKSGVVSLVSSVLEGERDEWTADYRFRRHDDSWATVSVRGYVVRDENGKPLRMVGGMNDITEKHRNEERIAQQAALLDRAHDAIIVRDMEHRITFWNQSAERIYGWTRAEAEGKRVYELLDEDVGTVRKGMRALEETGEWTGELLQKRKDGGTVIAEVAWTLVNDDSGRPRSVMAINTEITDRVALEEQLRQSQRLESIGQLTGGVAHDFNNLLTVILGNAELLSDQLEKKPRLHKLTEMTRMAAVRGSELTHRLLAFARRQALEPKVIDANELVENMQGMLRRTLLENIDIQFEPAEYLWGAFVDPGQLESVLLNLCINAKDAMPHGGRLLIETANVQLGSEYAERNSEVRPGKYVMIAVSDTGVGIPQEHLERVFDPFFTTKEKGKGTGLGLSMAYGFVKQSHGHIKIYSEADQGTTVHLYLPRAERVGDIEMASRISDVDVSGSETVLVVEDNDLVRAHAESQLEEYGYHVLTAANGNEALKVLKDNEQVDLLFTDVIMSGGMNGRELAEIARRLRPKLKILYTSGYTENAIVHHGRLDPGVNLLQKPYQRAELARKVRSVLSDNMTGSRSQT